MMVVRHAVVGPFAANSYVLGCTRSKSALLVDPGGELDRLSALADRGGFAVEAIFLTHGHIDHVAAASEAKRRLAAPIQMHPADREWLLSLPRQAAMFGFEEAAPVPEVDRWLADGDLLEVGSCTGRVIHTPGHTEGSCSLWFEEEQLLLTGDTLFVGSVGRTDLPGGDAAQLERSIVERLFPLGDGVRFYPGHGPPGVLGDERRDNPFVGEEVRRGRFL